MYLYLSIAVKNVPFVAPRRNQSRNHLILFMLARQLFLSVKALTGDTRT